MMDWYNAGHVRAIYAPLYITKVLRQYTPQGNTRLRKRHRLLSVQYEYQLGSYVTVLKADRTRKTPLFFSPEEADRYMKAVQILEMPSCWSYQPNGRW